MRFHRTSSSPPAALRGTLAMVSAICLALWGLVGCIADSPADGMGQVVVRWAPADGTCEDNGIATVRISAEAAGDTVAQVSDIDCAAGSYTLTLSPGVRNISITGYGVDGKLNASAETISMLVLAGASQTTPVVPLSTKQGSLRLSWRFPGDASDVAAACTKRQLTNIEIVVYTDSAVQTKVLVPCSKGTATVGGIPLGYHGVTLSAQNANGSSTLVANVTINVTGAKPQVTWVDLKDSAVQGRLTTLWTVGGLPPVLACAKADLVSVDIYVLSDYKVKVEKVRTVQCGDGVAEFDDLGLGQRWVMMAANKSNGDRVFSVPQIAGPYTVTGAAGTPPVAIADFPLNGVVDSGANGTPKTLPIKLTVHWNFGGQGTSIAAACAAANVATVRVDLLSGNTAAAPLASKDIACSAGVVTFPSVPDGTGTARVSAKGAAGATAYLGTAPANMSGTAPVDVTVILVSQAVVVTWTVAGDDPSTGCAAANLQTVTATFQGPPGSPKIAPQTVNCADGQASAVGNGTSGNWTIKLSGTATNGDTYATQWSTPVQVWSNGDSGATVQANLVRTSANLSILWQVGAANAAKCTKNATMTVKLSAQNGNGQEQVKTAPCDAYVIKFSALQSGNYFVSATVTDTTDGPVLQAQNGIENYYLGPGENAVKQMTLAAISK